MIILTAVGRDRPGMAHAVAQVLADAGCNIEDTTMTRLCGEFAMILIVSPPPEMTLQVLSSRLAPLENSHGLFINAREIAAPMEEIQNGAQEGERYILSVYAPENRGLIARMTQVLSERKINISDVQTRVASGGALYVMLFEIELPRSLALETLKADIESAAKQIGAQVSLNAIEENTL